MARKKKEITAGMSIGRWTVLEPAEGDGERRWRCRCTCGTEREVLERGLLYGFSLSCGCQRAENVSKRLANDLTGQVFGELTVLCKAKEQRKTGGIRWMCRCSCGKLYDVRGAVLVNGTRTHCPDKSHERNYMVKDISKQRFFNLTAEYPTEKRDNVGSVVWHCVCDCGNVVEYSYNRLVYGKAKSCGCRRRAGQKKQPELETV